MEIIAEVGLNHGGNLNKALEMTRVAKECGASIVKFQFYYTDVLCVNRNCFDAYKLLDKIRMRPQWIPILADECKQQGVEFLCTAFCKYSIETIAPYVQRFKIASPEVANLEFVKHVASYGKPLILSNGKITLEGLEKIFDVVSVPISILLCVSKYPAAIGEYDLTDIHKLKKHFKCPVGLSDHTQGLSLSIKAAEMGADIIERHFMTDKSAVDVAVSLMPNEFLKLTDIIRRKNGN